MILEIVLEIEIARELKEFIESIILMLDRIFKTSYWSIFLEAFWNLVWSYFA